jgi:hypothetical protein
MRSVSPDTAAAMDGILSLEDEDGTRCVDIVPRPDGTYCFKEFRRDPEDGGRWSLIADFSDVVCRTKPEARDRAAAAIPWFRVKAATARTRGSIKPFKSLREISISGAFNRTPNP